MNWWRTLALALVLASAVALASAIVPLPKHMTYQNQIDLPLSPSTHFYTTSKSSIVANAITRIKGQIFLFPAAPTKTFFFVNVTVHNDDENLQFGVGMSRSFLLFPEVEHVLITFLALEGYRSS